METILVALISAGIPALTTLLVNHTSKKEQEKQAKRSNIMALISMDKINVLEGKLPINAFAIHQQYDEYKALGGNSFIADVVSDYDEWLDHLASKPKTNRKNKVKE